MTIPEFTPHELEHEEWRSVVGYEGFYSVSSLGRVRRDHAATNTYAGRILKPSPTHNGYLCVPLSVPNRKLIRRFVHLLVSCAFIGPRNRLEVNHKDTNKKNNRANNLEYVTSKENKAHASQFGLMPHGDRHHSRLHPEHMPRGEQHVRAKLTNETVRQIRAAQGTYRAIGKQLGVFHGTVGKVKRGEIWKHVV